MIITITLNTMLDKTVYVGKIEKGKIQRAERVEAVAGGKGVNVSRQLKVLGCRTIATGFYGGAIGKIIGQLMSDEGLCHDFIAVHSCTREGVTYREADGTVTAVFELPHEIEKSEADELVAKCVRLASKSSWVIFSGSSPHRNADSVYREIMDAIADTGVRTVLDTYGEPLRRAIGARPYLFKPNKHEYEATFGVELDTEQSVRRALDDMIGRGVHCVMLTDGHHDAYIGTPEGHWIVRPPDIEAVNPTGSGDAMIAGFIYAQERRLPFEDSCLIAVAAGAANAAKWSVADSSIEAIVRLKELAEIRKL
jgi:tagatose 6-phosphate kinase